MQCSVCGTVNNPGRLYCGGCARIVGEVCPVCSFVNEPIDRYCGGCARDRLAVVTEPAPAVRAAAVGPLAPAAAAAPDTGGLMPNLLELDDLIPGKPTAARGELGPAISTDATQKDVDGFFQQLAREGAAEINVPTAPGLVPGTARSTPS